MLLRSSKLDDLLELLLGTLLETGSGAFSHGL